jgi:hypothetical protein
MLLISIYLSTFCHSNLPNKCTGRCRHLRDMFHHSSKAVMHTDSVLCVKIKRKRENSKDIFQDQVRSTKLLLYLDYAKP